MQKQRNKLNFEGQNIYVGIDVHNAHWTVTVLTEFNFHKKIHMEPSPEVLDKYLRTTFPNADYYSVYEAGFCGFWIHYRLVELGINNIVVNAMDIPTTGKEKDRKDDSRDSGKLADKLRSGNLKGIHIPLLSTQEARSLIRTRKRAVTDMTRMKNRIKQHLHFYGIEIPKEYSCVRGFPCSYIKWLHDVASKRSAVGRRSLEILTKNAEDQKNHLKDITRDVSLLSRSVEYRENINLLQSISGIGALSSIIFLVEIEDISRFCNCNNFASYFGIVPSCHTTGDGLFQMESIKHQDNKKFVKTGEMTRRAQKDLRSTLIE